MVTLSAKPKNANPHAVAGLTAGEIVKMCAALVTLFTFGCKSTQNTERTSMAAEKAAIRSETQIVDLLSPRFSGKEGQPFNILVLSGGAAHGAWGAGVLNGWNLNHAVPKWDVVTGISTGALLSTFAFLGEDGDFERLHTSYTQVKTSDIIRRKWFGITFLAAIFSDSLYDSTPLKRRIKAELDDETIKRVAEAGKQGRRLFVGTVSLYSGDLYIWDMTSLAQDASETGSADLFDLYREVLRASAAIPAYFPAVPIRDEPHVDGGTREQLFFREKFLKSVKNTKTMYHNAWNRRRGLAHEPSPPILAEREANLMGLPEEKVGSLAASPVQIYVIVNGRLGVDGSNSTGNTLSTGLRSISILTDAALVSDLFATEERALAIPEGQFHYLAEPTNSPPLTPGEFDGNEMTKLYHFAYEIGKSGQWKDHVDFEDVYIGKPK